MIAFSEAVMRSFFELAFTAALSYMALWLVDSIKSVDVSWRRRLLFVALSAVFMLPTVGSRVALWFAVFFLIEWVLLKWIYSDSWKDAAIRVILWYVFLLLFVLALLLVRMLGSFVLGNGMLGS